MKKQLLLCTMVLLAAFSMQLVAGTCALTVTSSVTNPTCGQNNGFVSITINGGSKNYAKLWSTKDTNLYVSSLAAGTYKVTVTDRSNQGCATVASVTLVAAPVLAATLNTVNESCAKQCTGSITCVPSGGVAPYTYKWSNTQNKALASNLCAGTYSLTILDASACAITKTAIITEPTPLALAVVASPADAGKSNGSALGTATGGTSPYAYAWTNAGKTNNITGLAPGTYALTVTDAKGCTINSSAVITSKLPPCTLKLASASTPATCGLNNGSIAITLTASGGSGNYQYAWSVNGIGSATLTGIGAGTYSVTVTDKTNTACSATAATTIVGTTAVTAKIASAQGASCGLNNGAITVAPKGGSGAYRYTWSVKGDTSIVAPNLGAGAYTVTVSDAASKNCTATAASAITATKPISAVITASTNASCGLKNGTVTVVATGGSGTYHYFWSTKTDTLPTAKLLGNGNYQVTVVDALAKTCTATASASITSSSPVAVSIPTATNASCGLTNGVITATAIGGTGHYHYQWSNKPDTTNTIKQLTAGTYTVTVSDLGARTCTATTAATIVQNAPVTAQVAVTTPVVCGANNGVITVKPAGGSGSYVYKWSVNGQSSNFLESVGLGTYSVTVSDALFSSCTATSTIAMTGTSPITVKVSNSVDASCSLNNGSITVSPTGGSGAYVYNWSANNQTTATAKNLAGGSYAVTVTDKANSNCYVTTLVSINAYTAITAKIGTLSGATCGNLNGSIAINATGGTGKYKYTWSIKGDSLPSVKGLGAGTYSVTVSDASASGCTASIATSLTATQPVTANVLTANGATCGINNGTIAVTGSGGSGVYKYAWSQKNDSLSTASNLGAGGYTITVSDAAVSSCTAKTNVTLTGTSAVSAKFGIVTGATCGVKNGSISVIPAGGSNKYLYSWSVPGDTSKTASNLGAGKYTVTVIDAKATNCVTTLSTSITQTSLVKVATTAKPVTCFDACNGTVTVTQTGGVPPYTVLWSTGSKADTVTNLCADTYTVTVKDSVGCIATAPATVASPAPIVITPTVVNPAVGTCKGSVSIVASGGVRPYAYKWNTGSTTTGISNVCPETFGVVVTDANGCTSETLVTVASPKAAALVEAALGSDTDPKSILEATGITKVLAYPNPFNETLNIIIPTEGNHLVQVYDLGSRLNVIKDVVLTNVGENRLDFSGVAPGIYMVRVTSAKGVDLIKVIKQ